MLAIGIVIGLLIAVLCVLVELVFIQMKQQTPVERLNTKIVQVIPQAGFIGEADEVMADAEDLILGDEYDETDEPERTNRA